MNLIEKMSGYRADWLDVGLTKIAVFAGTLFIAKIWEPVLSLEWYWYVIIWIAAAIKPLATFFKWNKKN